MLKSGTITTATPNLIVTESSAPDYKARGFCMAVPVRVAGVTAVEPYGLSWFVVAVSSRRMGGSPLRM
jgi:hypothetical protein